jgi:hypothetical protein
MQINHGSFQGEAKVGRSRVASLVLKGVCLCLATVVLSGCLGAYKPAPKSREEALVSYKNDSGMWSMKQHYTSQLRYEAVVKKVKTLSEKCLNFDSRVENVGSGPSRAPTGTWIYRTKMESVSPERAELTMRRTEPAGLTPSNHMPEGGYFYMLANFQKTPQGLADIVVYAPRMGADDFVEGLKAWSQGSNSECPIEFDK